MKPQLTINLQYIRDNYRYLKTQTNAIIAASVKANSYGLGAEKISFSLFEEGCRDFFVAHLDEGIELKKSLPDSANIYILNGVSEQQIQSFLEYNLIPVLSNIHQIEIWKNHFHDRRCIIHIDTGMNRLGLHHEDWESLTLPIQVDYIMSHLACDGDEHSKYNHYQLEKFIEATSKYPGIKRSLAASGGIFLGQNYHFDMVRPGAALYGIGCLKHKELKNPITLTAPIIHINHCKKDEFIGYGSTAEVQAGTVIATIPIGYADGYSRFLSNQGIVFVNGKPAKILGRISMDLTTIDVTGLDANIGDEAQIIGEEYTPDEIAATIGTIGYEVITSLNYGRFHRSYIC